MSPARPVSAPAEPLTALEEMTPEQLEQAMEFLQGLSQALFPAGPPAHGQYVTTNLLRYERSGHVTFAGGHQYIVVCRADGSVERVQTPGPWLGIAEELPRVKDYELVLAHGDVMVLYTDGIIEARDRDGQLFEMDRLCAAVQGNHGSSVAQIRDAVLTAVRAFMHEQEDDMTVLVMRYVG